MSVLWRNYPEIAECKQWGQQMTHGTSEQAEKRLKEAKERYEILLRNIPDAVYSTLPGEQGTTTFMSEKWRDWTGYSPEDFYHAPRMQSGCIHPEDRDKAGRAYSEAHKAGREYVLEYRVVHKDTQQVRYLRDHGVPVLDEAANLTRYDGIVRDVTERKLVEQQREKLLSELEAKNAELERFTYTVSHDLKGPLLTIKGFSGYLMEDAAGGCTERLKEDIGRIDSAAAKMQQLLDELLALSRIGRVVNPPAEVSLGDLVREAVSAVAFRVESDGVQIRISPHLPVVYGDGPRLVQALQNLIENAAKFMGDQAKPRIEIGARQEGDEVLCFVRDNGMGIDPKYHDRVFGLFDKLDQDVTKSTGIGLSLVKRIIEVHGGRIWIESQGPGRGSTFWFTLPQKGGSSDGES